MMICPQAVKLVAEGTSSKKKQVYSLALKMFGNQADAEQPPGKPQNPLFTFSGPTFFFIFTDTGFWRNGWTRLSSHEVGSNFSGYLRVCEGGVLSILYNEDNLDSFSGYKDLPLLFMANFAQH